MILLTLQRWFTLSNPITHMLWGFKFGRGTLCLLQHLRPHLPTAARHVTPFFMSSNSFFLFHCLQFYRLTGSQAKFLFVSEQEVWPETSQSPLPGSWFDLWFPLEPHSSSHPAHIFLPVSCHKCFFLFHRKPVSSSNSHISEAFLFLNFIVNSFSLHCFLFFLGSFSFSEAHLSLSGCI